MKKQLLLSLFLLFGLTIWAQDLFDDSFIHEIRINSNDPNFWDTLSEDYDLNYPDVPYQEATVTIDGNEILQTGVRQKGFSSNFLSFTNKKPLKLHFEKFVDDQEYQGMRKLNLANGVGDPAIVKDKLAYDIFRMHGIPAPRVAHAKVFIDDAFWGIYAMIEQIDKRYLKRNFADNDGNLWKNQGNSDLTYLGDNPDNYGFELQTNENANDWSKFLQLINAIDTSSDADFANDISEILDMDEYLRIYAVDVMLNNWDSYLEHGRNWYLYFDPVTQKIHWQPWDYNFSFDRESSGFGDFNVTFNTKRLNQRIQATPEFREIYLGYMCELIQVNMTEERLAAILDPHLAIVVEDWDLATNNFFSVQDLNDAVNGTIWSEQNSNFPGFQSLKLFIENRRADLQQELANLGFTCNPPVASVGFQDIVINEFMADNGDDSPWSDQDGDFDDWIELYNNTNIDIPLKDYFLSDDSYFEHKWEFPEDAILPANGYYIVWADKDLDQDGIHAKFSLDKDGESIILGYLDGTVVDNVTFSEQSENISFARIPNGTGDFIATPSVTFNEENGGQLSIEDISQSNFVMFPNPTNDLLNIKLATPENNITIRIYDMLGRLTYQDESTNDFTFNISKLNAGIYTVVIKSQNELSSQKLIKL